MNTYGSLEASSIWTPVQPAQSHLRRPARRWWRLLPAEILYSAVKSSLIYDPVGCDAVWFCVEIEPPSCCVTDASSWRTADACVSLASADRGSTCLWTWDLQQTMYFDRPQLQIRCSTALIYFANWFDFFFKIKNNNYVLFFLCIFKLQVLDLSSAFRSGTSRSWLYFS